MDTGSLDCIRVVRASGVFMKFYSVSGSIAAAAPKLSHGSTVGRRVWEHPLP